MKTSAKICLMAALLFVWGLALAQNYPTQPIRMLVPFTPGGGTDISARVVGQKMTEALGQQIVIDNRVGASGHIAMEITARAAPNGYTLIMSTVAPMAFSPALFSSLPFHPVKDFTPVALVSSTVFAIIVHPSLPAKSVKELIALAKAQPGKLTFGSGGAGGASHIATELFQLMAGINMVHVPYKGGGAAIPAVMGGEVFLYFADVIAARQLVAGGRLRALGVTSARRSAIMSDLPTIAEAGLPGYEMTSWNGVLAPAGTPRPIVDRLNAVIVRILPLPDVAERLAGDGSEFGKNTPEQFAAFVRSEYTKWRKIIQTAKIKIE
ncbi:MAG: tripartite tricarboxylate transporter substrate binding protein [Betaproteobacteria bacterium]|nr:tripartite tricarboxylate transporter substrate binding protein [Betaproteobacteria bacterium]